MKTITLKEPGQTIELDKGPFMPAVLAKGLMLSLIRPSIDHKKEIVFDKFSSSIDNIQPDLKKINQFKKICGYPQDNNTVPMLYLQSLFIGLFGNYITSPFFPLLPLGLIHTKQSISQKRPIEQTEILKTKFTLNTVNNDPKGLEITFLLEVISEEDVVWEGITTTLCKSRRYEKKGKPVKAITPIDPFTTIDVPKNIGRLYAKVSGDFNPHHLSTFLARLFGFKHAIAHGMWSLARCVAAMEDQYPDKNLFSLDVSFKRPLFLPGTVALGATQENENIIFELRDNVTNIPHITGTIGTC